MIPNYIIYIVATLILIGVLTSCYKFLLLLAGVVIIPENSIGVFNKKWVLFGKYKTLPDGENVALNGEAGWQADTLSPGLHFYLFPWQYTVSVELFVEVENGQLGIVIARAGAAVTDGRVLAKDIACKSF